MLVIYYRLHVLNWTSTKMLQNITLSIVWKLFFCALRPENNPILTQKVESFLLTLWLKPSMKNGVYRKLFNVELPRNKLTFYLY